jgi:thioredoxin 1
MGLWNWLGLDLGPEREPLELTDENFQQEVLKSPLPVLIDLWSPGCGPCTALAPTVKRLTAKYEGRVKVGHLNAAHYGHSASRLRVRGTPTVVLFHKGREVERVVGIRDQLYFEEMLAERLGITGEKPN